MNKLLKNKILWLALTLGVVVGGAGMGTFAWKFWRPQPAPIETPAPAVLQADGSQILERDPNASAKPAQKIPPGATVERIVYVTVQPHGQPGEVIPPTPGQLPGAAVVPAVVTPLCPPVRVDLTVVRLKDLTHRVIASSPDGDVIAGLDVPVEIPSAPRELRWGAVALVGYDNFRKMRVYGGAATYQRGPILAMVGTIGQTGFAGVGLRF